MWQKEKFRHLIQAKELKSPCHDNMKHGDEEIKERRKEQAISDTERRVKKGERGGKTTFSITLRVKRELILDKRYEYIQTLCEYCVLKRYKKR
jgi:hypothetical protein